MSLPPPPENRPAKPSKRKQRRQRAAAPVTHLAPFSLQAGFAIFLAAVGFFLPVIGIGFTLIALILGHLAVDKIKRAPEPGLRGMAAARIALVLGYLSMVAMPIFLVGSYFSAPFVQEKIAEFQQKRIDVVMENGRTLWQTTEDYAADHNDRYPKNWTQLEGRYLSNPELRRLLRGRRVGDAPTSFRLVTHERPILPALEGTIIVIEEVAPDSAPDLSYEQIIIYDNGVVGTRLATTP